MAVCAKTDRFYDIAAAANTAIHEDFGLAVDGSYNFWEHSQGGWSSVQLTPTVIGDNNRGCPFVDGTFPIVGRKHPFDDNRPGPDPLEPANVFPGDDSPGR